MNSKTYKKFLQSAHLGAAVIVGMAISGMDTAPLRVLALSSVAGVFLWVSYDRIYMKPERDRERNSEYQPWDQQARDRLGLDED